MSHDAGVIWLLVQKRKRSQPEAMDNANSFLLQQKISIMVRWLSIALDCSDDFYVSQGQSAGVALGVDHSI
jgi:hypothetical protein